MILVLIFLLLVLYGGGSAFHIASDFLWILLVLALLGIVYQIWTGKNPF